MDKPAWGLSLIGTLVSTTHLPHGQHVVYVAAAELVQLLLQRSVLLRQLLVHGRQLRHLLLGLGRGGQVGSCLGGERQLSGGGGEKGWGA